MVRGEGLVEAALVVVVAVSGGGVGGADVDDDGEGGEEGRVTGADDGGRAVGGQLAKEVTSESFITVEMAIVLQKGRMG